MNPTRSALRTDLPFSGGGMAPRSRHRPMAHSLGGLDLHRAGAVTAEAVWAIHVFHISLRQHLFARRPRAPHVGAGDPRLSLLARSNAATNLSSRNSECVGSLASWIHDSVPVSPEE